MEIDDGHLNKHVSARTVDTEVIFRRNKAGF